MKSKVIVNIDMLGHLEHIEHEKNMSKDIAETVVQMFHDRIHKEYDFSEDVFKEKHDDYFKVISLEDGIGVDTRVNEADIIVRYNTENKLYYKSNRNKELCWDHNKTVLSRLQLNKETLKEYKQLFDVSIFIRDSKQFKAVKSSKDAVLALDSVRHPDKLSKVAAFVFDAYTSILKKDSKTLEYNIDPEELYKETVQTRAREIYDYVTKITDMWERVDKDIKVEDYEKNIQETFQNVLNFDSADGLNIVCV